MARRRPELDQTAELLELAAGRIELPVGELILDYQADADLLYIKMREAPRPDRTESDYAEGVLRHYEGKRLVSIEILDLYGVFV